MSVGLTAVINKLRFGVLFLGFIRHSVPHQFSFSVAHQSEFSQENRTSVRGWRKGFVIMIRLHTIMEALRKSSARRSLVGESETNFQPGTLEGSGLEIGLKWL